MVSDAFEVDGAATDLVEVESTEAETGSVPGDVAFATELEEITDETVNTFTELSGLGAMDEEAILLSQFMNERAHCVFREKCGRTVSEEDCLHYLQAWGKSA